MQISSISSMNFYGQKEKAAAAAKKVAKGFEPDFSRAAYSVPTGLAEGREAAVDYFYYCAPIDVAEAAAKKVEGAAQDVVKKNPSHDFILPSMKP